MKIKVSIKRRCKNCRIIKRFNKIFVSCIILKHKQRQG